jgi:hypothetical protein
MPSSRLSQRNPTLAARIERLQLTIHPIIRIQEVTPSGNFLYAPEHDWFPRNLLQYLTLSESMLDAMMHHYSQSTPDAYTEAYPAPANWDKSWLATLPSSRRAQVKRRKFGQFIGLRGCDTPVSEIAEQLDWSRGRINDLMTVLRERDCAKGNRLL